MKKLIACFFFLVVFQNAYASLSHCPEIDDFKITAPYKYQITYIASNGNILYYQHGDSDFSIYCKDNKSSQNGSVFFTISDFSDQGCTLEILDGPYETSPTIKKVSCTNTLIFLGMERLSPGLYNLQFHL